jgi:hypothetical protein
MASPMASSQPSPQKMSSGKGSVVVGTKNTPAHPPGSSMTALFPAALPPALAAIIVLAPATVGSTSMSTRMFPNPHHQEEKHGEKCFLQSDCSFDNYHGGTNTPITTKPMPYAVVSPQATATKNEEAGRDDDPLFNLSGMMLDHSMINDTMNCGHFCPYFFDKTNASIVTNTSTCSTANRTGFTAAAPSRINNADTRTSSSHHEALWNQDQHHVHENNNCYSDQEDIYNEIIRTFC